ncbi:MAG: hypothetical protein GYB64_17745, partial [Chloroflexi bacterium]|nr:hypothetical protein [Chloroflexota bacterium]
MRNALTVAWHEFTSNVSRPAFIIWTLLVPLVGLVALIIAGAAGGEAALGLLEDAFEGEEEAQVIGVVDPGGFATPNMPEFDSEFQLFESEDAARTAIME